MKKFAIIISCIFLLVLLAGCGTPPKFATGYSSNDDPATAARKATQDAIAALGDVPVKGLVFVVYYPKDGIDADNPAQYCPDESKEKLAAETVAKIAADLGTANGWARQIPKPKATKAVAKDASKPANDTAKKTDRTDADKKPVAKSADGKTVKTHTWEPKPNAKKSSEKPTAKPPAKSVAETPKKTAPTKFKGSSKAIPNIGCRARGMTQAGTLKQGVAVLAIGGHQANCRSSRIAIYKDRYASGRRTAREMQSVPGLKLVVVLAEMQLCFGSETESRADDFLRGMMGNLPRGTIMLGGNSMNVPGASGKAALAGREFHNGLALEGQIVSMGIGGPIRVYANQTSEFKPV
ncbi:MAG: hypothetical protein KAR11_06585, partial [Phycisphaerae bacterium]|nr:hypothetical protein [Phycisphaerae bacterium]